MLHLHGERGKGSHGLVVDQEEVDTDVLRQLFNVAMLLTWTDAASERGSDAPAAGLPAGPGRGGLDEATSAAGSRAAWLRERAASALSCHGPLTRRKISVTLVNRVGELAAANMITP